MEIKLQESILQPKWPLRLSDTDGPYEGVRKAKESLEQNFVFLLQTIPGEWPMNPDLGVGISKYLFETYDSSELDKFKIRLQSQLKKYLPQIKLVNAEFIDSDDDRDRQTTTLTITYSIGSYGTLEEINLKHDSITKSFVYVR